MSFRYLQAQKPADWIRHRSLVPRRACSGVVSQGIRLNKITLLTQTRRNIKMEKKLFEKNGRTYLVTSENYKTELEWAKKTAYSKTCNTIDTWQKRSLFKGNSFFLVDF